MTDTTTSDRGTTTRSVPIPASATVLDAAGDVAADRNTAVSGTLAAQPGVVSSSGREIHPAAAHPNRERADVTVVVPTRHEAGNVATLIARLDDALAGMRAEVIVVDDSDDDTPERARACGSHTRLTVRVAHREPDERAGGLGSAVVLGLRLARGTWAVVMDGDLQHPPELVPELVATGDRADADIVVATRYRDGGDRSGLASRARRYASAASTRAARAAFPRRLHGCTDPMSGFFAVRPARLNLTVLRPDGFKILLEILARQRRSRIIEVPFTFAERLSGSSKASVREGILFARRLASLRWAAWRTPRTARLAAIAGFAAVGVSGLAVNSLALWALADGLGMPLLVAAALATQVSTAWNFVLTDRWVFPGAKSHRAVGRLLGFAVVNNVILLGRLPALYWLVQLGLGYLWANLVTLLAGFVVRYMLSDRMLFTRKESAMTDLRTPPISTARKSSGARRDEKSATQRSGPVDLLIDIRHDAAPAVTEQRREPLPWLYNIHGLVRIGSVVRLSELDAFAEPGNDRGGSSSPPKPRDIEIRRGTVGSGRPRARARVTQYATTAAVTYQEHLGRLGADFHISMSDGPRTSATGRPPIAVTVGPMLVRSPHVLYVNVVEALLRFVLVSRGHMLLHSACLDLGGTGVMLSALTDTGKTGTVLRLLRETPARFLSDDMTVLAPDGTALAYPKPMTISQHTLRAIHAGDLTTREWRRLRIQSRVHSQEGRAVGARLGRMNLPIMSINALTQLVVPPPKYDADRLVPCQYATSVHVSELFIISRGSLATSEIATTGTLIDELIANTDDAYGFPPFSYFAPALVVDGLPYEELRAKERHILVTAMSGVTAHRLVTPDFSWATLIPQLLDRNAGPGRGGEVGVHPAVTVNGETSAHVGPAVSVNGDTAVG